MTKHASGRHQKSRSKRARKSDGLNAREIDAALSRSIKRLDAKHGVPERLNMRIVFGERVEE